MSEQLDEPVVLESAATPEQQKEAEAMGWIPPTRYKGEADRFVDADEFIKRGETVLPIVKEQNKRLRAELDTVRAESRSVAEALAQATKAINEIEVRHSVDKQKAVEAAKREVKAQLRAASEAGDHEGVAELTEKMVELNAATEEPPKKLTTPPPAAAIPQEILDWGVENSWFNTDRAKTNLALGIAEELRAKGETSTGRAFFDKVAEITNRRYRSDDDIAPPTPKVDGGRNGSGNGGTGSEPRNSKSFASLPAEAKAACDADAKQFVGANKQFKTQAEWRNRYAEIYYQE